jgi:diguanylate cyclase (GGDEF)-like protein/putative nucleotidyltransferase with HDIG domain
VTVPDEPLRAAARLYVSAVIFTGIVTVLVSLRALLVTPVRYDWFLLAGLTLLTGSFTVRIPTVPAKLSVSETFVFAAVLLFGPAAATMIVVLDTLIISFWLRQASRRPSRILFNMSAPSIAIWMAAHAFYWMAHVQPLVITPRPILTLLLPLFALAALYFLLNSILIAAAVAFEKRTSVLVIWRRNFLWLSLNYFSGASVAALLLPYLQSDQRDFARVVGVLLPLLFISYLTFKTALGRVDDANRHLLELNRLYLSTIETLAMAIDAKDQITHGHVRRVQRQAVRLAAKVGVTDSLQIQAIEAAALLHDMGKLAVPEYILNKPGPLTPAEFEKMKLHASVGADILSAIEFPYPVVPIVRHHHENWDGTGYPDRLAGAQIPIGARILSVVDCFDALTSDRPYRPRLASKDALKVLSERRGQMYDPLIVDTFMKVHAEIAPEPTPPTDISPLTAISEAAFPGGQVSTRFSRLEEITASGEEMLALFDIAKGLTGRLGFSDVSDVILKHLRRMVPSSLFVFYIYDGDADELVASYSSGDNAALVSHLRIPLGQRLSGWVGANRQTIRNSDPVLDLGEMARAITPRLRACLSSPVVANDTLVGVLSMYSMTADAFSEDHQRVVEVVARQVAHVVQQALAFDSERRGAYRDQLTGLPNAEELRQFATTQRPFGHGGAPMALVYIDVLDLKAINGAHGREVGDHVLNHVVSCARANIRPADVLFRYASDEFVIVLLHTDKMLAAAIGNRIKHAVQSQSSQDLGAVRIKASVGVASMPHDGDSVEALISAARQYLKSSPANRTTPNADGSSSIH